MWLIAWCVAAAADGAASEQGSEVEALELAALAEARAALESREEAAGAREAALDAREAALAAREAQQTASENKARKARGVAPAYRPAKEQDVPGDLGVPETTPVRQGDSSEPKAVIVNASVADSGQVDYSALRVSAAEQSLTQAGAVQVPVGAGLAAERFHVQVGAVAAPEAGEDWEQVVPAAVKAELDEPRAPQVQAAPKRGARTLARPQETVDVVQVVSKPAASAPPAQPKPQPQRKARSLAQASVGTVDVVQAHGRESAPVFEKAAADAADPPRKGARTLARPTAGKVDVVQVHS